VKNWGYLLALILGAFAGWVAQQFLLADQQDAQRGAHLGMERSESRLAAIAKQTPPALKGASGVSRDGVVRTEERFIRLDEFESRALALVEQGQFIQAIEYMYDQRWSFEGEEESSWLSSTSQIVALIEETLVASERWDTLIQALDTLVGLHPDHTPYVVSLVNWLIELKSYDEAEEQMAFMRNISEYQSQYQSLTDKIKARRTFDTAEAIVVPLRRVGAHFLAQVVVDEQFTFDMMLDTGATLTVLKQELAGELEGKSSQDRLRINTANGLVDGYQVKVELELGDVRIDAVDLGVMPLENFEYDGLLGMNVLGRYQFYIDQAQNMLYLN